VAVHRAAAHPEGMRVFAALVLCLLVLVAGTALGQGGSADGSRPDCVVANPTSGLGVYGNNLSVSVRNTCPYEVTCRVSADVNPTPTQIHLAPGASTDVGVYRESPARVFVAIVECPLSEPTVRDRHE
jgi:hypothetical protein